MTNRNPTELLRSPSSLDDFVQVDHLIMRESTIAVDDENVGTSVREGTSTRTTRTANAITTMKKNDNNNNREMRMDEILQVLLKAIKSVEGNIHFTLHEVKPAPKMMEVTLSSPKVGTVNNNAGDHGVMDDDNIPENRDQIRPINLQVTIHQAHDVVTRDEFSKGMLATVTVAMLLQILVTTF